MGAESRISVRVAPELDSAFAAAAQLDGLTRSQAARRAVAAYVESVIEFRNDESPGAARRGRPGLSITPGGVGGER